MHAVKPLWVSQFLAVVVALHVVALHAGCTDQRDNDVVGTQSLAVTLITPPSPGSPDLRLGDADRTVVFDIEAKDEFGDVDTEFSAELAVYAQFLGTLTPEFGAQPLRTFPMTGGRATAISVDLPNVFGPTVVWIDNGTGVGPDYVHGNLAGTTPELWFRDPFIADLQTPIDEARLDALTVTALSDKQIAVGGEAGSESAKGASRHGPNGRLVVNSVFAQGYTVSDVLCADENGTPPCVLGPHPVSTGLPPGAYDHAMVFTFSAPRVPCEVSFQCPLQAGTVISGFTGGLSEFLGLTEIGFPQTFAPLTDTGDVITNLALLPAPLVFQMSWFDDLSNPDGRINFERNEAAPIEVNNAVVCDLDEDFDTFKQWKIDPGGTGGNCNGRDDVFSVITTGITNIDPAALAGTTLPKIVGVLRPLNFDNGGNIWLIFPRSADDCPACVTAQ